MKLNEFQQAAVDEQPKDITVSAAAGSGKTQVLGARVLRRITGENPVDISRLLIVTFTRAAAAELRSRIASSVGEAIKSETDPERRRGLERQLSLLGGADICTIDSFCYRLLKQNFFRIPSLPGDFTVGDEAGVRLITTEAMRETVEMFSAAAEKRRGGELIAAYEEKCERFGEIYPDEAMREKILEGFDLLAMNYGSPKRAADFSPAPKGFRTTDYVDFVYRLKQAVESVPDPEAWLALCIDESDPDFPFENTRLSKYILSVAKDTLSDICEMLSNELEHGGLNPKNAAVYEGALEKIKATEPPRTYAEAVAVFASKPLAGLRVQSADTAKSPGNPHAAEAMARMRKIWDETAKLFSASASDIAAFRREIAPVMLALCCLTDCLMREELRRCLEKKKLGFSTCVYLALKLLTNGDGSPSETAAELRELYDEIYVDESQDIDYRQKALFDSISNGRLFMVGDVKQSIYGFRRAEPEIFNRRCEGGENSRLITMNLNYRSNESVIRAVNGVFSLLMNKSTMNLNYSEGHKMLHGESWLPPENPLPEFIAVKDGVKSYKTYKFELEAQVVADRIKSLLKEKTPVFDKASGEIRPMQRKDIIVLMRAVKADGPVMERILEENGIDCYFDGGESLFTRGEISSVTDILTLIDNDGRDIPLAGALRSVMFGFTENDLLRIRSVSKENSFSGIFRILSRPENPLHDEYARALGDEGLLARCVHFGSLLKKWRTAADFRPISEVISLVLSDTAFYSSVGAMKGGRRMRANLDVLINAAEEFERTGSKGLYSFLDYISKQSLTMSSSATEAKTLSESMDVVRIMTIHKSKGLEAPVIFLTKCSKIMDFSSKALSLDTDLGFSAEFINEEKGYVHRSPLSRLIDLRTRERERCEEIRLLYVAMTRPRERLICTGYFYSQKAVDALHSFDGEMSKSAAVFLADSYAKMLGENLFNDKMFSFKEISAADICAPSLAERLAKASALEEKSVENLTNLLGLDYEYPHPSSAPAKVSVSALKKADYEEETAAETEFSRENKPFRETLRKPAFAAGETEAVGAAQLGTAYHSVMRHLDLNRSAAVQLDKLAERGIITPPEHKLISADKIDAFLASPLAERMRRAKKLFREAPFMMKLAASELGGAVGLDMSDEEVAVQGIIDCFFIENDTVVLVDYKTDGYDDPADIAKKYEKQLFYYAKAINLKFPDKKVEKCLYLFQKNDIIEI